jgi:hypothetical protein
MHLPFLLASLLLLGATALAGEAAPSPQRAPREIYVPFSDLHVLLEQQPKRVLLGREEYNDLVKKAKKAPETHAPRPAVIIAADYAVTAGQQRAELKGTLSIDVLEDGLHALPLDLGGVGLQSAKLDGRNAAIGRGDAGQLLLFVEGLGRHELILEMVAPLETTAARQVLNFRLPRPAAVKLRLTAPGDVELKGGADVISRALDEAARVTRFELLPREGDTSLLMTLNSHLQRQQQAVVARSVLVDEVTEAYEKLHATVSLGVLYRAVDHFRFVVPEGFEITEVSSPLLARWDVQPDGPRKLLNVRLREQTTDTVVLNLSALKTPSRLEGWRAPRLEPLDVVGQVAVVGLLVEDRLQAESLAAEGLIPIDAAVLSQALPQSVFFAAPGTPPLRAVAAWYAPQGEFSLAARYKKPPAEMAVTTSLLLIVADKGHEVLGGLSLLPQVEKRFAFDLAVPAGWQVTSVTAAGEQPLPFERYGATVSPLPLGEGQGVRASRVRVAVPAGMPVGEEFKVNFRALRIPTGWLAEWPSAAVEFPRFAVEGATRDEGAIAVDVRDDITVRPEKLEQLTPLDAAEKPKYGLNDVPTTLAYRYENPKYAASLVVQRTKPRLTARTFSFLRIDPDGLNCHYELVYTVEEARTQRLALSLPKDTPASVAITALDGVKVKESVDEMVRGKRRWNVLLAEPQRGKVRLAVDFQQPLPSQEPKGLALPMVAAEGVEYQSGLLAVEGCAELEVQVNVEEMGTGTSPSARPKTAARGGSEPVPISSPVRRVDVGELADADYQPGRRLLGAYGFVGDPAAVKIDVLRHPGYPIYPAIVEQCELDTNLSPQGVSQTQARFKLRTKALYLQVKLPAGGELWSALLNGAPLKPQREGESLLIGLPAAAGNAAQTLQLTYAAPVQAVALRGTVEVPAPKLLLRADRDQPAVEVPLADLVWRLYLPSGYEVVRTGGTVVTDEIERPLPAAVQMAGILYYLTGGLSGPPMLSCAREAARTASQVEYDRRSATNNLKQVGVAPASKSEQPATEYAPVEATPRSAARNKIEAALESPTQLEFIDTPLSDVIDYLKDYHGIEIQVDRKALSDVGIGTDTPVTKNLKGTTLRSALRLTLRELGLTYVVQDDVLLFTTPEEAKSRLETKTYPVADLVLPAGASKEDQADFDSLIDLITSTAKPTTWDSVGGPGSIAPFETGLSIVVSQTQEGHREIEGVLEQMRQAMRETGGKGRPRAKPHGKEMGAFGDKVAVARGMGGMGGSMGAGMGGGMGGFAPGAAKKGSGATRPAAKRPEKSAPKAKPRSHVAPAEKPAADDPFADTSVDKLKKLSLDELRRIYAAKKAAIEAKRGELKRLAEQLGTSATDKEPGPGTSTVDIEMLRNEVKQLEESLNATANELQQQLLLQGRVDNALDVVERAHVPFAEEPPIAYPDADAWRKLEARRKEKYSSKDLARPRSAGDTSGGEELPSPDYSKHDAGYSPGRPFVGNTISSDQGLAGVSSLKIDVVQAPSGTDRVVTFRSLGVDPQLVVTLSNRTRFNALAWGLALAVALAGAAITRRPVRKKAKFIVIVMLLATIVPLLSDGVELAHLCNMLFFAASLLVPYYLVAGAVRWLGGCACKACRWCAVKFNRRAVTPATTALVMLAVVIGGSNVAKPQAAPYVIQVVEPGPPVSVPDDAIILPYDPDAKTGVKEVDKLLVPYEKYVELWNRAYPDKKIETRPVPAQYSLAGAAYKTLLEGDEYLLLTGQLEIDVFVEGFVQIPLGLGGGVLAQAELDGKPARLSVAEAAAKPQAAQQSMPQSKPLAASQPADRSLIVLHVSGKGRHKLELSVRLKLSRQGGWRVADGVLPSAAATALAILVPKPQTELRLGQIADRRSYETEKADEAINTALGVDGAVSIQWRPKVAEGQVDRTLTASSNAVLDVQEDGLRLVWQLALEFRRSQREQFSVAVPKEFLVEKVEGSNVRGWEIRQSDQGQTVVVTLLKAAKDREDFTLRLWRGGAVGQDKLAEFNLPLVGVTDAALHSGQLTIRRSPLLELRTLDRSGLSRTDLPAAAGASAGGVGGDESPLGIRPFEAYRFATTPFTMRLAATPVAAQVSANVQTVLKIAEYERSLESRVCFEVLGRPVYQLKMLLPDGLRLDRVTAPGEFQYAVTRQNDRPLLTIYLASGQQGGVPVLLLGRLGGEGALKELALPRLEVLGVQRQQGDVAVQVDPAFDVDAVELKNCDKVLLSKLFSWLNPQQQSVTRLGLSYRRGDYAGTLRFTLRKPDVVCDTTSNVRVTDRAIEETILLDFTIRNAGIRELSFLLPEGMAGSRISVPMLRQKTIEPVSKQAGAPLRVRIELQDEVMDQLRVLVENDRLLTPGGHEAPIPTVENGRPEKGDSPHLGEAPSARQMGTVPIFRTNRRYVAIENAGRDEVVVDESKLRELEKLGRSQKEWEMLKGILGREMTQAYLVAPDARQPRLAFRTEARAAVQTVGARIGLVETTLVLDANGAYRAQQVYHLDNTTEQFLEIQLPPEAELWTARVAGEPVKPTKVPQKMGTGTSPDTDLAGITHVGSEPVPIFSQPRSVRVPLIKTASGELDYEVVLKYGGRMPVLGSLGNVEFPLVHCVNIKPELSQVRLYVPEQYRWFDFGGTMRQVGGDADLLAGFIGYQTKQTERIVQALRQGDKFAKVRAASNLKQLGMAVTDQSRSMTIQDGESNANLQSELTVNAGAMKQALQEVEELEKAPRQADAQDNNRYRLNDLYQGQKSGRARNVVQDAGQNWDDKAEQKPADQPGKQQAFNNEWLGKNKLNVQGELLKSGTDALDLAGADAYTGGTTTSGGTLRKSGAGTLGVERQNGGFFYGKGGKSPNIAPNQPSPNAVVQGKAKEDLSESSRQQADFEQGRGGRGEKDGDAVGRYRQRLQQQAAQQQSSSGVNSDATALGLLPSLAAGQPQQGGQQAANQPLGRGPAPNFNAPSRRTGQPQTGPGSVPVIGDFAAAQQPTPVQPPATTTPPQGSDVATEGGQPGHEVSYTVAKPGEDGQPRHEVSYTVAKPGWETNARQPAQATGLASLDFELPTRGVLYRFTTPRGEVEVTARTVSKSLLQRLIEIAVVLVVVLVAWYASRLIGAGTFGWFAGRTGSTLLICLGVLSFCGGALPVLGLAALVTGCGLKVHRRMGLPAKSVRKNG